MNDTAIIQTGNIGAVIAAICCHAGAGHRARGGRPVRGHGLSRLCTTSRDCSLSRRGRLRALQAAPEAGCLLRNQRKPDAGKDLT